METRTAELNGSNERITANPGASFNDGNLANSASKTMNDAKEAVESGLRSTQERIGDSMEKAKEMANHAAENVTGAATYIGRRAEEATSSVGGAMETTGQYLKNDGLQHITADVSELIRRNPVPAMLIGVGLGVLLAQATARRIS